jgi:hypothetical protein
LFDAQHKLEESYELENIRVLQRAIRRTSSGHRALSLLQPFTNWEFLQGSSAQKKLAKEEIGGEEIDEVVQNIGQKMEDEHIKQCTLRLGRRKEALDEWCSVLQDKSRDSRWSSFSLEAQSAVMEIKNNQTVFEVEHKFLDLVVSPDEVGEGWAGIAIDPEVKDNIVRLMDQPSSTGIRMSRSKVLPV